MRTRGDNLGGGSLAFRSNTTFPRIRFATFDDGPIDVVSDMEVSTLGDFRALGYPGGSHRTQVAPLVQVSTTKYLGQPNGQWSVNLKGYLTDRSLRPVVDAVQDGDWCVIDVVKNGTTTHVMAGRIDAVHVRLSSSQRGSDVAVTVSGRDCMAAAVDTPIYFNTFDPLHNNVANIDMARVFGPEGKLAGAPHEVVPALLKRVAGAPALTYGHPPKVPAGVFGDAAMRWDEALDVDKYVQKVRGFVAVLPVLSSNGGPSLYAFVDQWSNRVLNEFYVDTDADATEPGSRRMFVHFREMPFENTSQGQGSPWFALPMHDVQYSTVQNLALSRGQNRLNHIFVMATLLSTSGTQTPSTFRPVADTASIARWGLRRYEQRSNYQSEVPGSFAEMAQWRDLIVAWNAINARHWNGLAVLKECRPEIRVGQKIAFLGGPPANYDALPHDGGVRDKALTAYVEAVQHTLTVGERPTAETQLMVSRGYDESRRLADVQDAAGRFQDVVAESSRNAMGAYAGTTEGTDATP